MAEPQILYVDEISPDEVRATVSDKYSVFENLASISRSYPGPWRERYGNVESGVAVLAAGRYICMVSRSKREEGALLGKVGMVLLDLTGKEEMGYAIAGKFNHPGLEERFMEVLYEVSHQKEKHDYFRLVVGKSPQKRFL